MRQLWRLAWRRRVRGFCLYLYDFSFFVGVFVFLSCSFGGWLVFLYLCFRICIVLVWFRLCLVRVVSPGDYNYCCLLARIYFYFLGAREEEAEVALLGYKNRSEGRFLVGLNLWGGDV